MQVDFISVIKNLAAANNIQVTRVAEPYDNLSKFDYGLRQALDPQFDWADFGRMLAEEVPPNTLVMSEDVFDLHYVMFRMTDEDAVYIAGPWITKPRSEETVRWCIKYLGPEGNKAVEQYYNGVYMMEDRNFCSELGAMLSMLYPVEAFQAKQVKAFRPLVFLPDLRFFNEPAFEKDLPAAMLEQRYEAETAMLDAVSRGDVGASVAAHQRMMRFRMESRFSTPLRDVKNTLLVINTLLRKAIQRSAVHPYYIDRISARYAIRIENMTDPEKYVETVNDMLREYCTYVQRYSLKKYSPLVQKVINQINLNLSSQLSLKNLAAMCFISPSYLSYLFKQETGQTLTDYINTQRVERAARRLYSTNDSIAVIAESVGILDVNYFTKIFKKSTGMTPTAYRKSHQK